MHPARARWIPLLLGGVVACTDILGVKRSTLADAGVDGAADGIAVDTVPPDVSTTDAHAEADSGEQPATDGAPDLHDADDAMAGDTEAAVEPCPPGTEQTGMAIEAARPVCAACSTGTYCIGGTKTTCPEGSWDDDSNPATECVSKTPCPAGQHVDDEGTPTTNRTCAPCLDGTFSSAPNAPSCADWQICGAGTYVTSEPSAAADRGCTPCPGGSISTTTNAATCEAVKAPLAMGGAHTCAVVADGTLKCWGFNADGQLGLGDKLDRGDQLGEMGKQLPVVSLGTGRSVKAIYAGYSRTCAVLDNGRLKCWGYNGTDALLGLGDTENRGDNPNEMGDALPEVDLGAGRTVQSVALGAEHTCALLDNGTIKCWGYNSFGLLGSGDDLARGSDPKHMGDALPAVNLGSGRTATAVSAGWRHTCALLDNGAVKCWGWNTEGELGLEDQLSRGGDSSTIGDALPVVKLGNTVAKAIACGGNNSCALLESGAVKCWGSNRSGSAGTPGYHGSSPGTMGEALPTVDLGSARTALAVAAGGGFTCALLDTNQVKCWGVNARGQLGLGDEVWHGNTSGEMGDFRPTVDLGTGRFVTVLAVGGSRACAYLDNGALKCWGANSSGSLGLGDEADRGDNPDEMGDLLPAIQLR